MSSFAVAGQARIITRRSLKRSTKILIAVGIAVALIIGIYSYLCYLGTSSVIQEHLSINGVNVEGMTKDQALSAIEKKFVSDYSSSRYIVTIKGKEYRIDTFSALSLDASAEVSDAYRLGHGTWITRGAEYIKSEQQDDVRRVTIQPSITDTSEIWKAAEEIAATVYKAPVRGTTSYKDGVLAITKGVHGESVDAELIAQTIIDGLYSQEYSGEFTIPVIITEPFEIKAEMLARALYEAPVNARYEKQGNEIVVIPSTDGFRYSENLAHTLLADAEEGETVVIPSSAVAPDVTTEYLQSLLFRDQITGYTVNAGSSWSQLNNQGIACEYINGTVLMPGEVFSFNDIVGDTTADKGYVEDYAYESGRLTTVVGGGVCRVASTLYAAILHSDLEVVMRYNHSSPVGYVPLGMDATVSYPLPDLQFRNNRDYPIIINMSLSDGCLYASISGTHIDGEPTVDVSLSYIDDMRVVTYRDYYNEQGELIDQVYMHTSVYKPLIKDEPEETEAASEETEAAGDGEAAAEEAPAEEPVYEEIPAEEEYYEEPAA